MNILRGGMSIAVWLTYYAIVIGVIVELGDKLL